MHIKPWIISNLSRNIGTLHAGTLTRQFDSRSRGIRQ